MVFINVYIIWSTRRISNGFPSKSTCHLRSTSIVRTKNIIRARDIVSLMAWGKNLVKDCQYNLCNQNMMITNLIFSFSRTKLDLFVDAQFSIIPDKNSSNRNSVIKTMFNLKSSQYQQRWGSTMVRFFLLVISMDLKLDYFEMLWKYWYYLLPLPEMIRWG